MYCSVAPTGGKVYIAMMLKQSYFHKLSQTDLVENSLKMLLLGHHEQCFSRYFDHSSTNSGRCQILTGLAVTYCPRHYLS